MQAAASKMDSIAHPLVQLYCEDNLAAFLIRQQLVNLALTDPHSERLINVVPSGPINEVKIDYERHKRNFRHLRIKLGYAAIFDGDYRTDGHYSMYDSNPSEQASFIYPYDKPEKFLVRAFLSAHPNEILESALDHTDHHTLFEQMVGLGLAAEANDAKSRCYEVFKTTPEYQHHSALILGTIRSAIAHFTACED